MSILSLEDRDALRKHLEKNIIANSAFLSGVFHGNESYELYATEDLGAALAIHSDKDHMIFAGDWSGLEIPRRLLPEKAVFVSASPPSTIEILKIHYELEGEWPCWLFLAPPGYGSGEWDGIDPIRPDEVAYITPFWELGGDDREEHIRDSVNRFESACLRIDDKPVSWCGLHFELGGIGNLGFAHTLEQHRRKGYAGLVTKALVNKLHRKGSRAIADVIKTNTASMHTCKSLGFEIVGERTWAEFKAR